MTVKGGTSQACASCKYQRRKCSSNCLLAPYFPPDNPKRFQNAHKLFGVSNISKLLNDLKHDPTLQAHAMESIIYHSNIRDAFPVHGCYGIICELKHKINQTLLELQVVNAQLEICRQQFASFNISPVSGSPQEFTTCDFNEIKNEDYVHSKDNIIDNSWWGVQQFYDNFVDGDADHAIHQAQLVTAQRLVFQGQQAETLLMEEAPQEDQYDDQMHPFFETIGDSQYCVSNKEVYESSCEPSLKDKKLAVEGAISENDLKSAAACFSLTSVS